MTDHVLYRMFDPSGDLLYVGITMRPVDRLRAHSKDKNWWSEIATIRLETYPDQAALKEAERSAIRAESPRYNIVLNGLPRPQYYSVEQVAAAVCGDTTWPSIKWLHRQITSGKLSGRRTKGVWRFTDANVDALLDACSHRRSA